jgi:hypothetical protein
MGLLEETINKYWREIAPALFEVVEDYRSTEYLRSVKASNILRTFTLLTLSDEVCKQWESPGK